MKRFLVWAVALLTAVSIGSSVMAADDVEGLEERLRALEEEVEVLKEEDGLLDGTTVRGYGELHYNGYRSGGKDDEVDFHRFVLFVGHEFNDWIRFDSELEVEHAVSGDGQSGGVELEQAFVELLLSRKVNVRGGILLVPTGIINSTHEPPTFYGVERPDVDKKIIPTTWGEAGVGILGELAPGLSYNLYYVSSLDASGFTASNGIRGGRQKTSKAKAEDFALTGRLEYSGVPGLKVGASFFTGDASQGDSALGDATVTVLSTDVRYSIRDFDFRGVYATIDVDDADRIMAKTGEVVGERMVGWYVEGAWRMLGRMLPYTDQELAVFARYSQYDTQKSVPSGSVASGANDVEVVTVGLDYKPHPNVVIKLDYQDRKNDDPLTEAADQFNIGIGYMF